MNPGSDVLEAALPERLNALAYRDFRLFMAMRVPRAVEGGAVRGSPAQARGAVSFLENIETMGIVGY